MPADAEASTSLAVEQTVLESFLAWAPDETERRRVAADRARERALRGRDEAEWRHAEIAEQRYQQIQLMTSDRDTYFARISGHAVDPAGDRYPLDVRVHKYPRSEEFPWSGGEMLAVSHLAALADLVRNPSQGTVHLHLSETDLLRWPNLAGGTIQVADCRVEDVEMENGQILRVAPRYGAIYEDRVRRRLKASAEAALDVLADVLDPAQNLVINDRSTRRRLVVLDGSAGTGKTVVAAHRIAVVTEPDSPGLYVTPTASLRDYVAPVLPRLGLLRHRARAVTIQDLLYLAWPDWPETSWSETLAPVAPPPPALWERAFRSGRPADMLTAAQALRAVRDIGRQLGWSPPAESPTVIGPLLWLGVLSGRRFGTPPPRWVIVDEAQDVPLTVMAALSHAAGPDAQWVLAGDLMQQMAGQHTWDSMRDALQIGKRQAVTVWLAKNYRVPPVIHERAERLRRAVTPDARPSESVPWHPEPGLVRVLPVGEPAGRPAVVLQRVREALQADISSIAVIPAWAADEEPMAAALRRDGIAAQVLDGAAPYRGGVAVGAPEHVRGLEFDSVILADVSAGGFPETPLGARRLYTCLSRARRRVDLLIPSDGSPWASLLAETV